MTNYYIAGVDIGGTFTDCVVVSNEGTITLGKALSTPDDFSIGVIDALRDTACNLGLANVEELTKSIWLLFHACTVGDNSLITRMGAKTGLITTRGFEDTVLVMRGNITAGLTEEEAALDYALTKPEPFVPRYLIEGISERVDYKGRVLVGLNRGEVEEAVERLITKGVQSIAVGLLWSISNDAHEKLIAEVLSQKYPSIAFSLSSEVAPFLGEYERTITTVFNAYIAPRIAEYLQHLLQALKEKGLSKEVLVMQAYGGVLNIADACKKAVGTVESSPASGVVGSQFLGTLVGEKNILATDMGGTTFKVSVIREGVIERDYNPVFMRYRLLAPKIWVESIGAGGGSIAWIDRETGRLKVGPQGAGAQPGPVCYGFGGTEPTVADADLILGYLNEDYFLGGRMTLDKPGALRALEEKIANPLQMSITEAAAGIYRIANSHMSDLIRKATVERGHDPRNLTLFAFGGAAPVHASRYAAELGVRQVLVPATASVNGAMGLIASDVVYEYGKSEHLIAPVDVRRMNETLAPVLGKALEDLHSAGFDRERIRILRSVDMRYGYQVHELNVPLPEGTEELTESDIEALYPRFDAIYEETYGKGSAYREAGMEFITFRVTGVGLVQKPHITETPLCNVPVEQALKTRRQVFFQEQGNFVSTPIYDYERMVPGMEIAGPAVIESPITTLVVNPKDRAAMDEYRNVRISVVQ